MQQINSNRKIESVQARVLLLVAGLLLLFGFSSHALAAKPVCGNFVCEGNEARTCPADCDAPPPPPPPPPTGTESCGCGTGLSGSQAAAGRRYFRELVVGSNPVTKYEVRLPSNYDVSKTGGHPVLLYLHGWGGNERSLPAPFARHGKNHGYLIVTPRGYGDGGNNSWNGFRSARLNECPVGHTAQDCNAGPAQSPSTCVDIDGAQHNYCYDSCKDNNGECPKWDGANGNSNTFGASFDGDYTCYWTTCLDSVAQIEALLNELESLYCIDRSMVWVSGCSNGGMFVYELAKDSRTSARFAGYLPQVGAPHPGFSQSPTAEVTPPRYFM
ncbi:MAG: hypothetical protein OES99_10930, partial [Gammaproteobacteria bacterium]|nr:hypothetical protein [Gammaproteobacteria bacterium]